MGCERAVSWRRFVHHRQRSLRIYRRRLRRFQYCVRSRNARSPYLPKRVRQPPTAYPDAPGRIRRSNDLGPATDEFGAWRRWVVDLPAPGIYEVAWFAFPGLRATLNDEPLTILDDDEPRGLVRFELPAGHHVVNVWYSKPPGQTAGSGLAALGLLLVLGGLRYGRLER